MIIGDDVSILADDHPRTTGPLRNGPERTFELLEEIIPEDVCKGIGPAREVVAGLIATDDRGDVHHRRGR